MRHKNELPTSKPENPKQRRHRAIAIGTSALALALVAAPHFKPLGKSSAAELPVMQPSVSASVTAKPSAKPVPTSQSSPSLAPTPKPLSELDKIKLLEAKYPDAQAQIAYGTHCIINYEGKPTPTGDLSNEQRVLLILNAIKKINTSKAAFNNAQAIDDRYLESDERFSTNFNGTLGTVGTTFHPAQEVKYFVFSNTGNANGQEEGWAGDEIANFEALKGPRVGAQYYVNASKNGQTAIHWLTQTYTEGLPGYDRGSIKVLNGVCDDASATTNVLADDVYIAADYLSGRGFLSKTGHTEPIVDRMVRGAYELVGNEQAYYRQIIMDPLRDKIVETLENLGYPQ